MTGIQARWRESITAAEAELRQVNDQIASLAARRSPGKAADDLERSLKRRHEQLTEDLEEFHTGLRGAVEFEKSPARVAARKAARKELDKALSVQGAVVELAAELDAWAAQGLALFDQLGAIADGRVEQVVQAAKAAFPGLDNHSSERRRVLIEWAAPHARAWPISTRYALVVLLGQIALRIENAQHVFVPAPGWQFDSSTVYSFSDAAQQQQRDLEQNLGRIHGALAEADE